MGAAAAKVALALGIDGLAQWVIRFVVTLLVVSLVVVLIVVQTVASVLTGGQAGQRTGTPGSAMASTPVAVPVPSAGQSSAVDLGTRITQLAEVWLGVPYLFGGCSRAGVDCSCLVQNVYAAAGIHLPRVAVDQFNATVPIADPQPGDMVFFTNTYMPGISHVGIYIGNGMQINAPTRGEVERSACIHWVLGRPLRRCSQNACLNGVSGILSRSLESAARRMKMLRISRPSTRSLRKRTVRPVHAKRRAVTCRQRVQTPLPPRSHR